MNESVVLTLPNPIYERIKITAQANSLSLEEVISQAVMLLLPALESDLPLGLQLNLAKLALLNDVQLWKVAHSWLAEAKQTRLEELAEWQKHRSLTTSEQLELDKCLAEAQQTMLCKAEARRLLAQRGHLVFDSVAN